MLALIVAIIVLGLAFVISTLVMFRYGLRDNQTLPPSTAADNTLNVGTLIAFAIAASPYLDPEIEPPLAISTILRATVFGKGTRCDEFREGDPVFHPA